MAAKIKQEASLHSQSNHSRPQEHKNKAVDGQTLRITKRDMVIEKEKIVDPVMSCHNKWHYYGCENYTEYYFAKYSLFK